jgi:hypothetical protein
MGCVAVLWLALSSAAQDPQRWINFTQTYYKILTARDGIYRVTFADLQAAGFPVNSVDPRMLQLFHRGTEQAIHFQHAQTPPDGQFDPTEFFEFYGRRNDGARDAGLYKPAAWQPHTRYNLFTDTTAFFLTWNLAPVQGRRVDSYSEVNTGSLPAESHQLTDVQQLYTSDYAPGVTVANVLQYTHFDQGEGWTGPVICVGNAGCAGFQDFPFSLPRAFRSGAAPRLELQLNGRDDLLHQAEIWVGPGTGSFRMAQVVNFVNFETPTVAFPLQWSDVSATGQLAVRVRAVGVGGGRDRLSVSYIHIAYPETWDIVSAAEKFLRLEPRTAGRSFVEAQNLAPGSRLWDITNPDEPVLIGGIVGPGVVRYVVRNTTAGRRLLFSATHRQAVIQKASFRSMRPQQGNYIVITHPQLRKPAAGLPDPVAAYAGYRASPAGGGFDTLVVNMQTLYDQFNYGETSPTAIYEFVRWMVAGGQPRYLFIVGKGREVSDGFYRRASVPLSELRCLVPPAGLPAADMAFSAGLRGSAYETAVPTGRLSASTPAQVAAYLRKVIEFETPGANEPWTKRGLHLSGGANASEVAQFRVIVDEFKQVAENPFWGASIATISKREPSPVEFINISRQINEGVNLVTFFGHSSPAATDIDIGFVTDPLLGYNNPGKYPAFLVNGCNAGSFFFGWSTFGEDWMMAPGRGARAFIAHSSYGFASTLRAYSNLFYQIGFADSAFVQRGIGDVQQEVTRRYIAQFGPSLVSATQTQQAFLLGDPAVRLLRANLPDLTVADANLSLRPLDGRQVTAQADSFAVRVVVRNTGLARPDSLRVKLTRISPVSTQVFYQTFPPVFSLDTLSVILRGQRPADAGMNRFEIHIDDNNRWRESNEDNNRAALSVLIPLNGTQNLYPLAFAVEGSQTVELMWQNTNLLTHATRDYVLQIDTVNTFNSPYLTTRTVPGQVLVRQNLLLLPRDSVTYFWRTRLANPGPDETDAWAESSFTHVRLSPGGWGQFTQAQLVAGTLVNLEQRNNQIAFAQRTLDVQVNTYGAAYPFAPAPSLRIDNLEYNTTRKPCRNNTINLVAFDKSTLMPYMALDLNFFDPRVCGREPQVINSFTPAEMVQPSGNDLAAYVAAVGVSDSVLLFSIGDAGFAGWPAGAKTALRELGIDEALWGRLAPGEPVVILARKGAPPGTARVFRSTTAPVSEQALVVSETLTGFAAGGSILSPPIGPATRWARLAHRTGAMQPSDRTAVTVYGLSPAGQRVSLLRTAARSVNLESVSAAAYPFLQLQWHIADSVLLSAPQLRHWVVEYEPVPEGLVTHRGMDNPISSPEGPRVPTRMGFTNISKSTFSDSLVVQTFQRGRAGTITRSVKIAAPLPGDTTAIPFDLVTRGQVGWNSFGLTVNPRQQAEQYFENNQIEFVNRLQVIPDRMAPVLDARIDGRFPADMEFISPNPVVEIDLYDENPFLFKEDTAGVNLFWRRPCGEAACPFQRIALRSAAVAWQPQTADRPFSIRFTPTQLPDGVYEFRFEITDVSGNMAGGQPLLLRVQVRSGESAVFRAPYPNPSRQTFTFDLNLSGAEQPRGAWLEIRTTDGRLVRSFSSPSFSDLSIGFNAFTWDGTDAQGNLLRSGLYLYQWTVETAGGTHRTQGKLTLIR